MTPNLDFIDSYEWFAQRLDTFKDAPIYDFCRKLYDITLEIHNSQPTTQEAKNRDRVYSENTAEIENKKHLCNIIWEKRKEEIREEMLAFHWDIGYKLGIQEEKPSKTWMPRYLEYLYIFLEAPFQKEYELRRQLIHTTEAVVDVIEQTS